ncbi:MAG TPA: metalloregulator ArsR/SmtB family transcription factor [Gaiellales bacterium]|jgi:DNA-binding transcriptional ArsR family regulator|nr:metalloregulator ArsR/SmtB family transcription factor [Gaiellales bacterium]
MASRPLTDPVVELVAARFRAMGEPLRIKLLDHLRQGEASVGELTAVLGANQQNVSRHLAVLHGAGIVGRRKLGTKTLYSIADPTVFALCDTVCGALEQSAAELARVFGTGLAERAAS